jgi:pilus assembly protein CpaE
MALSLKKEAPQKFEAYAIANDMRRFDLLVEDLNTELSNAWAPLTMEEGLTAYAADPFDELEFVIVAVDRADEENLGPAANIISTAKSLGCKVLLVAHELTPVSLHQLMRLGADDFAPYPLPDGALSDSLERLRNTTSASPETSSEGRNRNGMILPIYGISGGVGASTFAVNLAWEMAQYTKKTNKRVCILDFNFQFGSVATYLDLPRREAIYDLLTDAQNVDKESLSSALTSFKSKLAVLTAPLDALPLDIVGPEDVEKLLKTATASYDFVIIDMPTTLVSWSDKVLQMSETFFTVIEMDMRSAQNTLRFLRTLKAEDLPYEKIQYALNRAPGFADMNGKTRIKRMSESLGIALNIMLPDGGKAVTNSSDQGLPLSETAAKNALRKEVRRIATSLVDMAEEQKAAIA